MPLQTLDAVLGQKLNKNVLRIHEFFMLNSHTPIIVNDKLLLGLEICCFWFFEKTVWFE